MDHFDPETPHGTQLKDYPEKRKTFVLKQYEELILGHSDPIELLGGVFIEMACPPELKHAESEWVNKALDKSPNGLPYAMVTSCDMQNDNTETIELNKKFPRWRGFR